MELYNLMNSFLNKEQLLLFISIHLPFIDKIS